MGPPQAPTPGYTLGFDGVEARSPTANESSLGPHDP
jgi:hypothetical protein